MQTTIREIIRPVSQTVVKHWLKTLSLPHSATNADDLRQAEIELIQPVSIQRTWRDQIDVGLPQRERSAPT